MREIGSEFWLEREPIAISYRDGCYVLSGRTAIDLIIQDIIRKRPIRNAYLPAWSCDSMVEPFLARGIQVELYDMSFDVSLHYHIDTEKKIDIFYVSNYFGYDNTIDSSILDHFKENGSIIIYDKTHSFLMPDDDVKADYSFASIRKWMGVVAGAVVNDIEDVELKSYPFLSCKTDAMKMKKSFIDGDKSVDKQAFLNLYSEFGHHLAGDYCNYEMDDLSYSVYKSEDLVLMCEKRRANAYYLQNNLNIKYLSPITDKTVPLFVPVFFESNKKRNAIRKKLIDAQIYCPIHWPKNKLITPKMEVNRIFDTELSLICDQRYGIPEMQRIIETTQ